MRFLRDWRSEDLSTLEYWLQPDREWQKTDGPYYPPATLDEVNEKIQACRKMIENDEHPDPRTRLAICLKLENELWGCVSSYWISKVTHWMAIGISIYNPKYWGKGIGFEALGLRIDYLFERHREIIRLDIRTWTGNRGMISTHWG